MPIMMYQGKPLSGERPKIAIDLFDSSLTNLVPSYLTHKLNEKIMNGLTDKSGTITVDGNVITAVYDDGVVEKLTINENTYESVVIDAKGIVLKRMITTVDPKTGKVRNDVTYDGSVNGVVDFATATWREIEIMLERHYAGIINLADFWSVGDTKTITYTDMAANGVGETHSGVSQKITIIGFGHDTITGGTKSAITLQLSNGLGNPGYIHPTNTNVRGWGSCDRRAWCNGTFFNSLEEGLRDLIKPVDKYYTVGNRLNDIEVVSDKCFLLSESEIMGEGVTKSYPGEGEQYAYYISGETRKKRQNDIVSGYDNYFTRSACKDNANQYVYVESDGDIYVGDANSQYQIIPAFCI